MTDDEKAVLEKAFRELYDVAERDCYGCSDMGQEHVCCCESCVARRARKFIESVIEPDHVSLREDRLTNPAERVFLERWRQENKREAWLNHGFTALEWILCPTGQRCPERVSQRDAHVAASVIQWLGTSCGNGFIFECERRIKELDINFRGLRPIDMTTRDYSMTPKGVLDGAFDEAASYVAGQFFPATHAQYPYLKAAILKCMRTAEQRASVVNEVAGSGI